MSKIEQILEAITNELKKLNEQPIENFSGDTQSRIAVRLASYKAGLGTHLSEARSQLWLAEKAFKEAKATNYKELRDKGASATDANELKIMLAGNEYNDLIDAQTLEDRISTLSYNIHDIIDSIKSRLIHLQMEKRENDTH